ncbi:MAG: dihydrolipoyl dehydrogenase [Parvularcula sp.]|jgi:dihydrolipoamide dehydrogenase|nr:dihydrolipoyl dehydrogenase [Parvularcula sp.]
MKHVDVMVIGAGTAGLHAFHTARKHAENVVLVEAGPLGTTCARSGCMPSKTLIASSRAARTVKLAAELGVGDGYATIDTAAVMRRVRSLRDEFVASVTEDLVGLPDNVLIRATARFAAPGIVEAGGQTYAPRSVVIAAGSVAVIPDRIERALGDRVMTIEDLWELESLPESLLLFGAGPIGVETGQALARLGVRVTCLSKGGSVGFLKDPEVTAEAVRGLSQCMTIETDADILALGFEGSMISVRYRGGDGEERSETFEAVLAATGRRPNLESLDLERSGLVIGSHGVPLFDPATRLCEGEGDCHVFLAGDVDAKDPVLPKARTDGDIAGINAATWPLRMTRRERPNLFIAFTDPAMAQVGLSYQDAAKRSDFVMGTASYENQGRARCEGRAEGLLRLYGSRATRKLLGGEMICHGGEHIAHTLAWAMSADVTIDDLAEYPVYHPVLEEGLRTALEELRHAIG